VSSSHRHADTGLLANRVWRAAAFALASSSLALVVIFADTFLPSNVLEAQSGAVAEIAWTLNAARTGCRNWGTSELGNTTVERSADTCGGRCRQTSGCIGFSYSSACTQRGSCILRSGSCDALSSTCWDQYGMLHDSVAPAAPAIAEAEVADGHSAKAEGGGAKGTGEAAPEDVAKPLPAKPPKLAQQPKLEQAKPPDPGALPKGWPRLSPRAPEGVELPDGWEGPWDYEQPSSEVAASATYGFYLPVFNQAVPAILSLLASVRNFYTDSPTHVLQDGGFIDFGAICVLPRYRCTFEQVPPENSRWNPHSWLLRFHRVAKRLGTTYVIYLEPDVLVRGRHRYPPAFDAGGIYDNFNPQIHQEIAAYMQKLGRKVNPCFKVRWRHFGLAGGSYFRTAAILDAFDGANVRQIDWGGLFKLEGERIYSSDIAMHVALSVRGYTVYPWRDSAQKWNEGPDKDHPEAQAKFALQWPAFNPLAAFAHNHKEHYSDPVPSEEKALLAKHLKTTFRDLFCHGCVWHRGPSLETPIPVKNPQTWDLFPPPDLFDEEYKLKVEELSDEPRHREGPHPSDRCFQAPGETPKVTQAPKPRPLPPTTVAPSSVTSPSKPSAAGLPILAERPPWLVHDDGLVIDARKEMGTGGGILIASTVLVDGRHEWGGAAKRPGWLRAALATNRNHAKHQGHAMVVRWKPTLRFPPPWQEKECDRKENKREIENCWLNLERENFNWEKHEMMINYLNSPEKFTHVFVLDADAVLVQPDHDTVQDMIKELEDAGKDLFLTNEDWIGDVSSLTRINGGLLFAKNTPFTRGLFEDMLDSHWLGPDGISKPRIGGGRMAGCASNEQLCLDSVRHRREFKDKVLIKGGLTYNCGTNDKSMKRLQAADPTLQILHFMGGSKSAALRALCQGGRDLTGEGPRGYGCGA